ncbi:M23 family metallopeptidase [Sporosarcina sp. FA9]|uniref:M23 family metallopeptidase n=1 Tax=Sporosarcina sp. FA9 TaxID=3413030 RepID=UPI003F6550E5
MNRTFLVISFLLLSTLYVEAEEIQSREEILEERMSYYVKYSNLAVPWYYLAAVDQFERNIQQVRSDLTRKDGPVALQFSTDFWVGHLNPFREDTSELSIAFFNGFGQDGDSNGVVDIDNNEDIMYTMATFLGEKGFSEESFKSALKLYYERDESVNQIITIAKIYKETQTLHLDKRVFPLPVRNNYSYQGTFGGKRGWGGRRIHEGTDLFASYGVPVRAVTYGVVEIMGWNDYGGWRVGIRDVHNTYIYYAHLSGFNKEVKEGDVVEPGTVLGWVGSSGYGKEGTSGLFPPHLHFGMYKYNGKTEWAFDPFPYLKIWEQRDKNSLK